MCPESEAVPIWMPTRRQLLVGSAVGSLAFIAGSSAFPTAAHAAQPAWVKPLAAPISYTQGWEGNGNYPYDPDGRHRALDMQRVGYSDSAVYSMASGEVIRSRWIEHLGYCAAVAHVGGYYTLYAHLKSKPIVDEGDTVSAGQRLGTMGSTGGSWPVHLHLEMYKDGFSRHDPSPGGYRINPEPIVRKAPYPGSTPQPVGDDEMPSYVYKSTSAVQSIGSSYTGIFLEGTDKSLVAGGLISAVIHFTVAGLGVGNVMQFRYYQVDDTAGSNPVGLSVVQVIGTGATTYAEVTINTDCGDSRRLRIEALAASPASGVTITNVKARALKWA